MTGSPASAAAPDEVDLTLSSTAPLIAPGTTGTLALTVGNRGPAAARGVTVTVVTPFFVNIARPVPKGCRMRYANPDPYVPEVLTCTVATVAVGATASLNVPVTLQAGGPRSTNFGNSIALPGRGSRQRERTITDNTTATNVVRARGAAESAAPKHNRVGVYLASDAPPAAVGTRAATTLTVGNAGPKATTEPVRVTYQTPFFVNVDRRGPLPAGCRMLLADSDPGIPELVGCAVPAGLAPGSERRLTIPVSLLRDGPAGFVPGYALAASKPGRDADPWMVDNVHPVPLLALRGSRASAYTPASTGSRLAGRPLRLGAEAPPTTAVDLAVTAAGATAPAGTRARVALSVTNQGTAPTAAPTRVIVSTPFHVNVDRPALPAGCSMLATNPAPNIPEVAQCVLPAGIAPGAERKLDFPVTVLPGGPVGPALGNVYVTAGADAFPTDNGSIFVIGRTGIAAGAASGVDLWATTDVTALSTASPRPVTIRYGNAGGTATAGAGELVYLTPPYVNIDRTRALPTGCRIHSANPDPVVPEIVTCHVAPGLRPGAHRAIELPLVLEVGGPSGYTVGRVSVVPSPGATTVDRETNYTDNMHSAPMIAVRP